MRILARCCRIMATAKPKGKMGLPPRSRSSNNKPSKPQTRTLITVESPASASKSRSDSSLSNSFHKLSLNDRRKASGSASSNKSTTSTKSVRNSPVQRNISSASSRVQSLQDVVRLIQSDRAKNIVVMAGAGISTASGIPDFRSPGTGLYDNLQQYSIPYPEAIFDIDYFSVKPKPFFTLAKELYPSGKYRPNIIHYFVRLLHDKGLLLRMYTQNIDGFERLCGIPPTKLVEAHGTFATATCTSCHKRYQGDEIQKDIFQGKVPYCRKRSSCSGVIKPDIVFFGEDLPKRFFYYLRDFPQADLLLVLGTSLEVEPFAGIVDSTRYHVPRVLLNMKAVGPFKSRSRFNDMVKAGDLVESISELVQLLGWNKLLDEVTAETKLQLDKMETEQVLADSYGETADKTTCNRDLCAINDAGSLKPNNTCSKPPVGLNRPRQYHTRQYHTSSAKGRIQQQTTKPTASKSFALPSLHGRDSPSKVQAYRNAWNRMSSNQNVSSSSSSSSPSSDESVESSSDDNDDD